jgi:hypothetical protein
VPPEEDEEESSSYFRGGADGGRVGFSNGGHVHPIIGGHYVINTRHVTPVPPPRVDMDTGWCWPCERMLSVIVWARTYHDRKEAKRVKQMARYHHRRSAVVEVYTRR